MWSWQWIPKQMNSQKGFSLTSCALSQSEIPWIQFFDDFRCVPRNLRSGVFFSFFKTKGKKDTLRAVVSPGRTLRPSWRNHCSQGRRRIAWSQDTCLLSSIALGTGTRYGFGPRAGQSSFSLRAFLCSQAGLARHLRAGLVLSSPSTLLQLTLPVISALKSFLDFTFSR